MAAGRPMGRHNTILVDCAYTMEWNVTDDSVLVLEREGGR